MKKSNLLYTGIAALAFLAVVPQVQAGSYYDDAPVGAGHSGRTDTQQVSRISPAAGGDTDPYNDFTGVYGGGDLGYAFTDDLKGWNGGLFAGYGFVHEFDMLGAYAGAEIGYEWSGADGDTGGLSYKKDNAWNFSFRPGAKIMEDALGYAILGYSRAEFEAAAGEEDLDGLILGLGGQFDTNTAFKPRIEYTWTNYEDANIGGTEFDANENAIKMGAVFQF